MHPLGTFEKVQPQ